MVVMFTKLSNRKIKEILNYLKSNLPPQPTAVKELYSLPSSLNNPNNLQAISDHMGFYLGLLQSIKIVLVPKTKKQIIVDTMGNAEHRVEELKYSGLYKVSGFDHREIEIVKDTGFYFKHYLAVIAHECTHNYLYHHGIKTSNFDKEILTDLATIFLGFGHILLAGYEHCEWTNNYGSDKSTYSFKLGYIDTPTVRKAIVYSTKLRDWKYSDMISKYSFWDKIYFRLNLSPYLLKRNLGL